MTTDDKKLQVELAVLCLTTTSHKDCKSVLYNFKPCRLRNACKDNLSCLTGKANKRHVPTFREFMQPVITEMDPEECVEEQYKVACLFLYPVAAPVT